MFNFQMDRGSFMAANRWAQPNGRSIIGGRIKTFCLYQPPSFYQNLRAEADIPRNAFPAIVSSSRLVSFVSLWLYFFKVLITQILTTQDNSNAPSLIAGQRVYMLHMLLLPFLPIVALIVQNSGNLHDMMEYRMESVAIGLKVDGTTALGISLVHFRRYTSNQCETQNVICYWFVPKASCVLLFSKLEKLIYLDSWDDYFRKVHHGPSERKSWGRFLHLHKWQPNFGNESNNQESSVYFCGTSINFHFKSYLSLVSKVWLPNN